jgi:hypothetical protein
MRQCGEKVKENVGGLGKKEGEAEKPEGGGLRWIK